MLNTNVSLKKSIYHTELISKRYSQRAKTCGARGSICLGVCWFGEHEAILEETFQDHNEWVFKLKWKKYWDGEKMQKKIENVLTGCCFSLLHYVCVVTQHTANPVEERTTCILVRRLQHYQLITFPDDPDNHDLLFDSRVRWWSLRSV